MVVIGDENINDLDAKEVPNDSARINDFVAKEDAIEPSKLTVTSSDKAQKKFHCKHCDKKFTRKQAMLKFISY